MEKIQLNINDIPKYLIGSKLYNILLSNKIQNIKIFSKHYKETTKVNSLDDLKHLMIVLEQWTVTDTPYDIYQFIENAVTKYTSCLIVSKFNKCASTVVGVIYLMIKYKWTLMKALEYMNAKKRNFEITRTILRDLINLEKSILYDL